MSAVWAFALDHGAGGDRDGIFARGPRRRRSRPKGMSKVTSPSQSTSSIMSKRRKFGVPSNLIFGIPARSRATWRLVLSTHQGNVAS